MKDKVDANKADSVESVCYTFEFDSETSDSECSSDTSIVIQRISRSVSPGKPSRIRTPLQGLNLQHSDKIERPKSEYRDSGHKFSKTFSVQPGQKLVVPPSGNSTMTFENLGEFPVLFRLMSSAEKKFSFSPTEGVVKANDKFKVNVKGDPAQCQGTATCSDFVQIEVLELEPGKQGAKVNVLGFADCDAKQIHKHKIFCRWEDTDAAAPFGDGYDIDSHSVNNLIKEIHDLKIKVAKLNVMTLVACFWPIVFIMVFAALVYFEIVPVNFDRVLPKKKAYSYITT